jgi:uncharacterized protein (TIGR00730 family)
MTKSDHQTVKAYHSKRFLESPDARPIRIIAEYLEPKARFEEYQVEDTILIFGSARILSRADAEAGLKAAKDGGGDVAAAEARLKMSRYYEDTRELAHRLTAWSKGLKDGGRRFVICSGGGPGIMEAANRGASEARGENMGLGISLPIEQTNNPYITRRLDFEFHYFFMRKFWFLYLAKAVVIMPGGFGTLDELMEVLTLVQTEKVTNHLPVILYGSEYWNAVLNFEPMVERGTISRQDLELFHTSDSVDEAFDYITGELTEYALAHPGARL